MLILFKTNKKKNDLYFLKIVASINVLQDRTLLFKVENYFLELEGSICI